jgi:hypothetical protein
MARERNGNGWKGSAGKGRHRRMASKNLGYVGSAKALGSANRGTAQTRVYGKWR